MPTHEHRERQRISPRNKALEQFAVVREKTHRLRSSSVRYNHSRLPAITDFASEPPRPTGE